ncbi:MAG: sensor histidine kinase, partial [Gammaproteobacteria bacterium]|nr:sensor histidine kinase [Gammaproteobacteria bacterium]
AVQQHLHATDGIDRIEVGSYLSKLCGSLASSMIGDSRPIAIKVVAGQGEIESGEAVSIGLIVTELLINAIKYAFPVDKPGAQVTVTYEVEGTDWRLMVMDNGVGRQTDRKVVANGGLGTAVVRALAEQLGARIDGVSSDAGMSVSIARGTLTPHVSLAS